MRDTQRRFERTLYRRPCARRLWRRRRGIRYRRHSAEDTTPRGATDGSAATPQLPAATTPEGTTGGGGDSLLGGTIPCEQQYDGQEVHIFSPVRDTETDKGDRATSRCLRTARGVHRRQGRLRRHRPVRDRGHRARRRRQPARRDRLPAAGSASSTSSRRVRSSRSPTRWAQPSPLTTSPVGPSSPRSTARSTAFLPGPTSSRSCGTARRHSPTRATRSRRRSRN